MERGYIKLWRKIQDWEWYKDTQTFGFFVYLMMEANHKDTRYMGHEVPRGSLVCGRKQLSEDLNLGEQTIRTLLTRLKSTSEITIKPTNRFSIICIVNYDKYQSKLTNEITNEITNVQPAPNQHLTTSKECKNERSIYVAFQAPTIETVLEVIQDRGEAAKFWDFYESKGWLVGRTKMKDWRAAARNWLRNKDKFGKPAVINSLPCDAPFPDEYR